MPKTPNNSRPDSQEAPASFRVCLRCAADHPAAFPSGGRFLRPATRLEEALAVQRLLWGLNGHAAPTAEAVAEAEVRVAAEEAGHEQEGQSR